MADPALGTNSALMFGSASTLVDMSGAVGNYRVGGRASVETLPALQRMDAVVTPVLRREWTMSISQVTDLGDGEQADVVESLLGDARRFISVKPHTSSPTAHGALVDIETAELHFTSADLQMPTSSYLVVSSPGLVNKSRWAFGKMRWLTRGDATQTIRADFDSSPKVFVVVKTVTPTTTGTPSPEIGLVWDEVGGTQNGTAAYAAFLSVGLKTPASSTFVIGANVPITGEWDLNMYFTDIDAFEGGMVVAYEKE